MPHAFHIVDVFAREQYAGNQLAVVHEAAALATDRMQDVAREMAYSETTFVESTGREADGGWDVRIFTPTDEIPFAGHPTLGTAHVVREHLADDPGEEIVLNLDVGQIPVRVERVDGTETLWMTQRAPEFREALTHDALADVLSLPDSALDDEHPVRVISTGLPTIVVPLVDRAALTAIDLDGDAYEAVTGGREAKNVLAFCPEPRNDANDFAVRVFAPGLGVPEDPATGSSNGCLAAYLARQRYTNDAEISVRVEQGHEIDRPSLLHLRADDAGGPGDPGDAVTVQVGGTVQPVADGRLR